MYYIKLYVIVNIKYVHKLMYNMMINLIVLNKKLLAIINY